MPKLFKTRLFIQAAMATLVATLAAVGIVAAATTIGANISTAGNLAVTSATATSTFSTGGLAIGTSTPFGNGLFTVGTSTTLFYVDRASGNIGIGTANPTTTLQFGSASTISTTANNNLTLNSGGTGNLILQANSTPTLTINGTVNGDSVDAVSISRTWLEDTQTSDLVVLSNILSRTDASTNSINRTLAAEASIGSNNTKNFTATVGVRAIEGLVTTVAGSTGTITGVADYYAKNGSFSGSSVTNQYGLYMESLTGATNNYGLFFAGAPASGSIASAAATNISIMPGTTGNIGIGTTSPYAKLSVVGPVVAEYIHATSTTATSTFVGGVLFATGGGNVGIGTATPTSLLNIASTLPRFYLSDTDFATNGHWFLENDAGVLSMGTTSSALAVSATRALSITNAGNIGIGTTEPTNKLEVAGGRSRLGSVLIGEVETGKARVEALGGTDLQLRVDASAGENFEFVTATPNATRMVIQGNNGKVGIGTSSPASILHVSSGASATTTVEFGAQSTGAKTCFNVRSADGGESSFYINAAETAFVIEPNRCR